jgi:DNA repair exonuclease SbcCD ATPase subunit
MPASSLSLQRLPTVDPHALPSQCPYCDQPFPVEHAKEIRHRIDAREREQAEKLSAEIRQELAREKAQGEAAVRSKIVALEAANAALQEAMNERLAAAEQQTRAALSQYEALAADQEQILAQRLQDQAELIEREKQDAVGCGA